jgi:hypothetical protein
MFLCSEKTSGNTNSKENQNQASPTWSVKDQTFHLRIRETFHPRLVAGCTLNDSRVINSPLHHQTYQESNLCDTSRLDTQHQPTANPLLSELNSKPYHHSCRVYVT